MQRDMFEYDSLCFGKWVRGNGVLYRVKVADLGQGDLGGFVCVTRQRHATVSRTASVFVPAMCLMGAPHTAPPR